LAERPLPELTADLAIIRVRSINYLPACVCDHDTLNRCRAERPRAFAVRGVGRVSSDRSRALGQLLLTSDIGKCLPSPRTMMAMAIAPVALAANTIVAPVAIEHERQRSANKLSGTCAGELSSRRAHSPGPPLSFVFPRKLLDQVRPVASDDPALSRRRHLQCCRSLPQSAGG
jgi:hypothetical protein